MIARRQMLAGALAAGGVALVPGLGRAALPGAGRLGFDVLRASKHLGVHQLTFHPTAGGLLVEVAVDLVYKLGPLTLYRYTHRASERWAGGEVVALDTRTNDNGTQHSVSARREAGGPLMVMPAGKPAYAAPADALPATHWNQRELAGPWINTQDGSLLRPRVSPQGTSTVLTANGSPLAARHFALSGPVQLDMWYDDSQSWAGLSFTKAGSQIRYARQG